MNISIDFLALNTARESAVVSHLKMNYDFDHAKERGEWVEVNLSFPNNDLTLTYVRAKGGVLECVVQDTEGNKGKTNFASLTDEGKVQQGEYYGLVMLCNHFGLLFANGIGLN
jgi:hypothetical protein